MLSSSFVLTRDIPTPGKFSTHIFLRLGSDKSFFTLQGPYLEHPVVSPFLPFSTTGRINFLGPQGQGQELFLFLVGGSLPFLHRKGSATSLAPRA